MKREIYESPMIQVLDVEVEKGFAASKVHTGGSNENLNYGGFENLGF